ncbi:MAG: hypothetical protein V3T77_01460 [Planctomycetota bacterium]
MRRSRARTDSSDERGHDEEPGLDFRPRRTVNNPLVMMSLLALLVVMLGVFAYSLKRRQEVDKQGPVIVETDNREEIMQIRKEMQRTKRLFQEAMKLRSDPDKRQVFLTKLQEAKDRIDSMRTQLDEMLKPVRDETGQLPDDYSGYERDYQQLNLWQRDLYSISGF